MCSSPAQPHFDLVSVVMPTHNGATTIREQLAALAGQSYRGAWELIIVDNGSTDGTLAIIDDWSDRLPISRIMKVHDRRGVGVLSNQGAAHARGMFFAFCHQDDIASPGWLAAMVRSAQQCDLVAGALEYERLNDPVTLSWQPGWAKEGAPVALGFLPYGISANLGLRAEAFRALGGWSESLTHGGENVEFCWRAQLEGYRFCYQPDAVMHYRLRSDVGSMFKHRFTYARAEPLLYKMFRNAGLPASSTRTALRTWAWALLHVPDLFSTPERQGKWIRKVAQRLGRLRGSLDARVIYL